MGSVFQIDKKPRFIAGCKVIKAEEYSSLLSSNKIIEEAHKQAALIAKQAEKDAAAEREKGFKEGLEQGKQAADARMDEMTAKAVEFMKGLEHVAVDLVMETLHKVMGEMDDTELVVKLIRRILSEMSVRKMLTIRVPVGMEDEVRSQLSDVAESYPGMEIFSVVGDSHLGGLTAYLIMIWEPLRPVWKHS